MKVSLCKTIDHLFDRGDFFHVFLEPGAGSGGFFLEQGDSALEGSDLQLGVNDLFVDHLQPVLGVLVRRNCLVKLIYRKLLIY